MMPTRWPSYILVILTAFLGWVVPFGLPMVWRLLGAPSRRGRAEPPPRKNGNQEAAPVSARFHLAALLFLGFLGLVALVLPLLFAIRTPMGPLSSVLVVGLVLPMAIVLFYCLRRGDLSWNSPRTREDWVEEGKIE